jgi:hypothetical protein
MHSGGLGSHFAGIVDAGRARSTSVLVRNRQDAASWKDIGRIPAKTSNSPHRNAFRFAAVHIASYKPGMRLTITSVDGPEQLAANAPLVTDLVRQIPGPDRPDYWIAELQSSLSVVLDNFERTITHLVLAARWEGTTIASGATHLPLGIAYVTDLSLLNDSELNFRKCHYVAIGIGSVISGDHQVEPLRNVIAGTIGMAFGLGKRGN